MAERFRVIISDEALADLEGIASYIRQQSPQNAAAVAERLLNAIDSLDFMPNRFRQAGRSRRRETNIHAMVVRPFIVYYRIDLQPPVVHILTIRHGARRQPRRLGRR